jgi:signal transduction histidine kinase/ActR/RegA family two-component response regulator
VRNLSELLTPIAFSTASIDGERDLTFPTWVSPAVRGPLMTRIGLVLIAAVASLGLMLSWLAHQLSTWGLLFFLGELLIALLTLSVSFSEWFVRNWEAFALGNAFAVIFGITLVSTVLGTLAGGIQGLLLLEVGSSAFLPWSPHRQVWLNGATIAGLAVFTVVWPRGDPVLPLYWLTILAGAVISQVACTTLYQHRSELERHIQTVVEGRKALAAEVGEHENTIAELEQTQAELVQRSEEALAASRTKSEFLSTMSHEIRTPLNSVLGMAELLSDADLKTDERRYLEIIRHSGAMLLELINSILDLARLESGRLEIVAMEFALRRTIEEVLEAFTFAAREKSLELGTQFAPGLPERVIGDSLRLRQVLMNLVGNAVKFTARGRITIAVEAASGSQPQLFRFSVADTGTGIPPDKLALIFEPFTQADSSNTREYGGTGLGLAIVARLVKEMGGEITVATEVGKGSTFVFTVKLEAASSYHEPVSSSDSNAYPRLNRQLRLLVADDVAVNRVLLRALLRHLPYEIDEVESGSQAIEKVIASKYDAVLMDMQMPAQDGYEATSAIRKWEREHGMNRVPIIALTASALDTDVERARKAGCDAHVSKPFRREDLLRALDYHLASETDPADSKS